MDYCRVEGQNLRKRESAFQKCKARRISNSIDENGVPKCKAFQDEWDEGFQEGFQESFQEGFLEGLLEGIRESIAEIFQDIDAEVAQSALCGLSPEAAQRVRERALNQGINLVTYLIRDGRMDEFDRMLDDSDYRRLVLKEYDLL